MWNECDDVKVEEKNEGELEISIGDDSPDMGTMPTV